MNKLESVIPVVKVLIVEDEKIISWHLREVLESQGYQVSAVASSGEEAIGAATLVKPDLALMDIRLNGEIEGIEAADFLYKNFGIPIIYLTALSEQSTFTKAFQTRPFGYLLKPFEPKELHCTIQTALQRHQIEIDLTEQIATNKRNEIALQQANHRWQFLLDNLRLIVVRLDCDGKVEYVNRFFLDATGYELDEVIDKDWFAHFLPQTQEKKVRDVFLDFLTDKFQQYYQNHILTKTGEERMIAWSNKLIHDDDAIIGTLSIGEDITDKLKAELIKSEFISVVSHELRTPLAAIHGSLGLLSSGVLDKKPENAKYMFDIAISQTERLGRLVNDILDLERLESSKVTLERQWYDAAEVCQQAVETMQVIAHKSQIKILGNVQSQQIFVNSDRIVQTLVNLLSNAIKFSPPQSQVQLQGEAIGDEILFKVSDRGRGIPENQLESIFERFNQVDASDSQQMKGTGLGLAICRSIVEQHGGKIWAESVLSEGSTFLFTIPLYTPSILKTEVFNMDAEETRSGASPCDPLK